MPLNTLTGKPWANCKYYGQLHPVYVPIVITYAKQLDAAATEIEVNPTLRTVSADSSGYHADCGWPNPVTGAKKFEYEIGNVYAVSFLPSTLPLTPCIFSVSVEYLLISSALHCAVQKERKLAKSWAFYGTNQYHGSFDIRDTFLLQ
jgi:hypothetical protein